MLAYGANQILKNQINQKKIFVILWLIINKIYNK